MTPAGPQLRVGTGSAGVPLTNGAASGGAPAAGISLTDVGRAFGQTVAIAGVNLSVSLHQHLSIIGASGCGKSTLLNIISGLDEPDTGSVDVLGATTGEQRLRRCAWMPQRDLLLPWRDALGNAALALENQGMRRKAARAQVATLVERFGLASFENKLPYQLSGGMRQRVSFLRTLVAGKEVLLLDEPFGALDSITRADLQQWLRSALDTEPRTTILVTHDVEEALLLGDKIIVMSARPGRVAAEFQVELPADASRRDLLRLPQFTELRDELLARLEEAS